MTIIGLSRDDDGLLHYYKIDQPDTTVPLPTGRRMRTRRKRRGQPFLAVLVGFEDERHRFMVIREVGEGANGLLEQFPSIIQSEDRVEFRFADENDMFMFKLLWEPADA
ncbi:MAG: hypothetical protein EOP83_33310 [Verrucomicrobiaceae bacterium]|nr:MAG: hypothetical protein EOP83_33310 [Verrucomicrobiaceae bacterium]